MYKYSVLTYCFNDYELVNEIEHKQDDVEYIFVTDNKNIKSSTWKVLYYNNDMTAFEKCYYVRFHPFEFVSTDLVVRLDASYIIKEGFDNLVSKLGKNDLGITLHPFRYNIVEEYEVWCNVRGYCSKQAQRCIQYMFDCGFDPFKNKGMLQEGFVIKRNNAATKKIDEHIYSTLKKLDSPIERIDQTITSFILQYYYKYVKILYISSASVHNNINAVLCNHNSTEPRTFECTYKTEGYWNNKIVQLV